MDVLAVGRGLCKGAVALEVCHVDDACGVNTYRSMCDCSTAAAKDMSDSRAAAAKDMYVSSTAAAKEVH